MNTTKKNGFLKAAGLMLAVMMLAICALSGTMAKYTTTGTGTGTTLTPAKWDVEVNGSADFTTGLSDLDWTIEAIKTGTPANDVVAADRIAPGTWGYAVIKVENKGEVDATLTVTGFTAPTVTPSSAGLTFSCYALDAEATTYEAITAGTNISELADGVTLVRTSGSNVKYIYVVYQWQYNVGAGTTDENDTTLGTNASTITIGGLTITATQVEPQKAE